MEFYTGGLVRWTGADGHIYIRRIHHFDEEEKKVYYYDSRVYTDYICASEASDALLYVGEKVKIGSREDVVEVVEVNESDFMTSGGYYIKFEDYSGRLNFRIVENLPTDTDKEEKEPKDRLTKLADDVCDVLDDANYDYERQHVETMISTWWESKKDLIEILRRHPGWDEEHLCVKGKVAEVRRDDEDVYLTSLKTLYRNCRANGAYLTDEQLDIMWDCVQCQKPSIFITKEMVNKYVEFGVEKTCGFVPHVGTKYSKILNKIFVAMGLDKYPNYNKDFAKVSDAINPDDRMQNCALSVHPCDFLKMSYGEKWNSCHDIRNRGCYHAGTQSYMMDNTSMVFYTYSNSGEETPWKNNKLTRQIFCYENGKLLQSRNYPDYQQEVRNDNYLKYVVNIFTVCTEFTEPDSWVVHQSDRMVFLRTRGGSTHYPDYEYEQYNTRVAVAVPDDFITIGHQSIDLTNGTFHSHHGSINGASERTSSNQHQDSYYICHDCGRRFYQDEGEDYGGFDGEDFYCEDHYRQCDKCGETHYGNAVDNGIWYNDYWYCDECADRYLVTCDRCGDLFDPDIEGESNSHGNYCDPCCEEAEMCVRCGAYMWDDEYRYVDGEGYYCDDCYDDTFTECESCGDEIRKDDSCEHDGDCLCRACFAKIPLPEETTNDSEESDSESNDTTDAEIDSSGKKYRITNGLLRLISPTTAFRRYGADNFVSSVMNGEVGTLVYKYCNSKVYVLKMDETNKYVAINATGCEEIGGRG